MVDGAVPSRAHARRHDPGTGCFGARKSENTTRGNRCVANRCKTIDRAREDRGGGVSSSTGRGSKEMRGRVSGEPSAAKSGGGTTRGVLPAAGATRGPDSGHGALRRPADAVRRQELTQKIRDPGVGNRHRARTGIGCANNANERRGMGGRAKALQAFSVASGRWSRHGAAQLGRPAALGLTLTSG